MSITNNFGDGGGAGAIIVYCALVAVAAVIRSSPVPQSGIQAQTKAVPSSEEPDRKKEIRLPKAGSDSRR